MLGNKRTGHHWLARPYRCWQTGMNPDIKPCEHWGCTYRILGVLSK